MVRQGKDVATFYGEHTIHGIHEGLLNAFKNFQGVLFERFVHVRQNVDLFPTLLYFDHSSLKRVEEAQIQHV